MGLKLSRQHRRQLLEWASEAGDEECCGLLLGRADEVCQLELSANVAVDPRSHFEIDPVNLIAAERQARLGALAILGYFHSHPNGRREPSLADCESASADGRYWLIIADGEMSLWFPEAAFEGETVSFAAAELAEA